MNSSRRGRLASVSRSPRGVTFFSRSPSFLKRCQICGRLSALRPVAQIRLQFRQRQVGFRRHPGHHLRWPRHSACGLRPGRCGTRSACPVRFRCAEIFFAQPRLTRKRSATPPVFLHLDRRRTKYPAGHSHMASPSIHSPRKHSPDRSLHHYRKCSQRPAINPAHHWYLPALQPTILYGSAYSGKFTAPTGGFIALRSALPPDQMKKHYGQPLPRLTRYSPCSRCSP